MKQLCLFSALFFFSADTHTAPVKVETKVNNRIEVERVDADIGVACYVLTYESKAGGRMPVGVSCVRRDCED